MFANRTSPPVGVRVAAFDANLPFLQMIVEEEGRTGTSLPVDALIALGELRDERRASSAQIARAIQRDDATAKRVAERLVEAGIVEAQGNTRARTYILSAKAYRALGSKAEYVRQAGFDALQQEQMVTKYAREHGSIRRQDVIELCRITDRQASRLLRKLVDSGHLTMAGTRKTAVYTPAHVGNPRKNKDMAGS